MVTAWDREADVVILGSGAAGLIAGLAAASQGAQVEIFEKAKDPRAIVDWLIGETMTGL